MADRSAVTFVDVDQRFAVRIMPVAMTAMLTAAAKAGQRETGGILIGRYEDEGVTALVMEATAKPRDSHAGWSWFQRGTSGLKSLLRRRWREGRHYVGEWHYHPDHSPHPSQADRAAIADIAADPRYHCPEPILAILGGSHRQRRIFVGVSPKGELLRTLQPVPLFID